MHIMKIGYSSKAGNTDENGTGTNIETPGPTEGDIGKVNQTQRASAIDPIAKALLTQRTKISEFYKKNGAVKVTETDSTDPTGVDGEDGTQPSTTPPATTAILPPPPPLSLVQIVAPASLSMIQLETIQITAQLIAISSFVDPATNMLQALTMREWNNPIFRFCQPRHGHFAYFSALVDAYKQILSDWSSVTTVTTLSSIKNTSARIKEIEGMANNVDRCLEVAVYRAEYQRDMEERLQKDEPAMANKVDWHDFVVVETIDFAIDEVVANLPPPTAPSLHPSSVPKPQAPYTVTRKSDSDMEDDDDDEEGEVIRVVPTYTPKISGVGDNSNTVVVDPISGKSVAVNDMPEHMRIQLLDPKWAEERKKFQEKQKESNLVSGDMVASNLERFAQARGDRFGKKVCFKLCFVPQ
jgi:splicing factor 3A subunit 1